MIAVYSKVNVFRYASIFRIQVSNPGIVLKKSQNLLNQSSSSVPVLFKVCKVSVSVGRSVSFIPLLLPLQHALHIYGWGFFSVSLLLPTSIWHIINSWKFFPFLSRNFLLRTTLSLCHWHERGKIKVTMKLMMMMMMMMMKMMKLCAYEKSNDGKNDWNWGAICWWHQIGCIYLIR